MLRKLKKIFSGVAVVALSLAFVPGVGFTDAHAYSDSGYDYGDTWVGRPEPTDPWADNGNVNLVDVSFVSYIERNIVVPRANPVEAEYSVAVKAGPAREFEVWHLFDGFEPTVDVCSLTQVEHEGGDISVTSDNMFNSTVCRYSVPENATATYRQKIPMNVTTDSLDFDRANHTIKVTVKHPKHLRDGDVVVSSLYVPAHRSPLIDFVTRVECNLECENSQGRKGDIVVDLMKMDGAGFAKGSYVNLSYSGQLNVSSFPEGTVWRVDGVPTDSHGGQYIPFSRDSLGSVRFSFTIPSSWDASESPVQDGKVVFNVENSDGFSLENGSGENENWDTAGWRGSNAQSGSQYPNNNYGFFYVSADENVVSLTRSKETVSVNSKVEWVFSSHLNSYKTNKPLKETSTIIALPGKANEEELKGLVSSPVEVSRFNGDYTVEVLADRTTGFSAECSVDPVTVNGAGMNWSDNCDSPGVTAVKVTQGGNGEYESSGTVTLSVTPSSNSRGDVYTAWVLPQSNNDVLASPVKVSLGGTITGRVYWEDSKEPVSGITVKLYEDNRVIWPEPENPLHTTQTTSDGSYRFEGIDDSISYSLVPVIDGLERPHTKLKGYTSKARSFSFLGKFSNGVKGGLRINGSTNFAVNQDIVIKPPIETMLTVDKRFVYGTYVPSFDVTVANRSPSLMKDVKLYDRASSILGDPVVSVLEDRGWKSVIKDGARSFAIFEDNTIEGAVDSCPRFSRLLMGTSFLSEDGDVVRLISGSSPRCEVITTDPDFVGQYVHTKGGQVYDNTGAEIPELNGVNVSDIKVIQPHVEIPPFLVYGNHVMHVSPNGKITVRNLGGEFVSYTRNYDSVTFYVNNNGMKKVDIDWEGQLGSLTDASYVKKLDNLFLEIDGKALPEFLLDSDFEEYDNFVFNNVDALKSLANKLDLVYETNNYGFNYFVLKDRTNDRLYAVSKREGFGRYPGTLSFYALVKEGGEPLTGEGDTFVSTFNNNVVVSSVDGKQYSYHVFAEEGVTSIQPERVNDYDSSVVGRCHVEGCQLNFSRSGDGSLDVVPEYSVKEGRFPSTTVSTGSISSITDTDVVKKYDLGALKPGESVSLRFSYPYYFAEDEVNLATNQAWASSELSHREAPGSPVLDSPDDYKDFLRGVPFLPTPRKPLAEGCSAQQIDAPPAFLSYPETRDTDQCDQIQIVIGKEDRSRVVSGFLWLDENKDGVKQDGERVLSGSEADVFLKSPDGTEKKVGSVVAGNNGYYRFRIAHPGSYFVKFKPSIVSPGSTNWDATSKSETCEEGKSCSSSVGDARPLESPLLVVGDESVNNVNLGLVHTGVSAGVSKLGWGEGSNEGDALSVVSATVGETVNVRSSFVNETNGEALTSVAFIDNHKSGDKVEWKLCRHGDKTIPSNGDNSFDFSSVTLGASGEADSTITCYGRFTALNSQVKHEDTVSWSAVSAVSGRKVVQEATFEAFVSPEYTGPVNDNVNPSVKVTKYVDSHDGLTRTKELFVEDPSRPVKVMFEVVNTGHEDLVNVSLTDRTTVGDDVIQGLTCEGQQGLTGMELPVGGVLKCSGSLLMSPGAFHENVVDVVGVGKVTNRNATSSDTFKAQAPFLLPNTGSNSQGILLLFAGVVLAVSVVGFSVSAYRYKKA